MLNMTVTKMEAVHGKWKLHLSRQDQIGTTVLWSVIRHPIDRPFIPPVCEVLTTAGWVHSLKAPGPALLVSEARLTEIAQEMQQ